MVAFQRDHKHSIDVRRSLGLTPFPRRRRFIAHRAPDSSMDVLSTPAPCVYFRSEATRHFVMEGAPTADDVQGMCETLDVNVHSARVMALVHDIAALLAELGDARRALHRAS
jgi:hypothetical protein